MSDTDRPQRAVRIPSGLREWSRDNGSPALQEWLARLPDAVAGFASRWQLSLGSPFEPGGTSSWVAPARAADGTELALKVAWVHDESRDEALGLSLLNGAGAVRVFDFANVDDTAAMVLERCNSGRPLRGEPLEVQHREIARILKRVRSFGVPEDHGLRPLSEMCDAWADRATDRYRYTHVGIDAALVTQGIDLFRELPRSATHSTLLLTDLHAGNVLSAERQPWLAIDPKPYVGDSTYDVLQHLLNCPTLAERPRALVAEVAHANDLDAERVGLWLFARCVIEGVEQPPLLELARELAP